MIYCTRKHLAIKTGKHNTINLRSQKKYSKDSFLEQLWEIQFPNYQNFSCINDFLEKLMEVIDKITPLREMRIKWSSKPWFDWEAIERINVRDKLKKKFNKTKLQIDYDNFRGAQKQAKQIIKMKKCDYVKEQLKENIAKPSKLWQTLKSIGLLSKNKNETKTCLNDNGTLYFESKETSEIFKNADDTCISFKHKNIKIIEEKLNSDFNNLCDWFLDNTTFHSFWTG